MHGRASVDSAPEDRLPVILVHGLGMSNRYMILLAEHRAPELSASRTSAAGKVGGGARLANIRPPSASRADRPPVMSEGPLLALTVDRIRGCRAFGLAAALPWFPSQADREPWPQCCVGSLRPA